MKLINGKQVWVFDNGGETFDRYTIVTSETNVFGASENPFHPQGFGQYCFTSTDVHERWYEDRNRKMPKYIVKSTLSDVLRNYRKPDALNTIGKEIKRFSKLPEQVQKYILQVTE